MPSAAVENGLHRPSGARAPARRNATPTAGESSRLTPAAMAVSLSPVRRLTQAWCTATSEEEQAVSTAMLGPRVSSTYARRPAVTPNAPPAGAHGSTAAGSAPVSEPYSGADTPTKTPVAVPARDAAGTAAWSRASWTTSSRIRCCGSITTASRGVIRKKSASNPAMSSR
ncbi:hypothetical protein SAURM35S_07603 [Streptomyces aurantiogriseus]